MKLRLPRTSKLSQTLLAVVFVLGFGLLAKVLISSHALSGGPYHYYISECVRTDNACVDQSLEAGIYRTYHAVLNRDPDPGGFSYWKDQLHNHNVSLSTMASVMLNSSEWTTYHSAPTNDQFVTNTYVYLLKRQPDSGGKSYWVGQLNSGLSRPDFEADMVDITEAKNTNRTGTLNYVYPPPATCPAGQTGTPPNCTTPPPATCPSGQTGTPPNCTTPPPATCPAGQTGTPPNCKTPTPAPAPKTSPPPTPKPTVVAPTTSTATPSGLQISSFLVSGIQYHSATFTWKTNKAATTEITYGTDKNVLDLNQKDMAKVTDHKLVIQNDAVKAGVTYYFRVASNDGSTQPATLDGDFATQLVAVTLTLLDDKQQVVLGAQVTINSDTETTNDQGIAYFGLPEGDNTVSIAQNGQTLDKTIAVNVPADGGSQAISVTLDNPVTPTAAKKKKGSAGVWIALLLLLAIVVAAVVFVLRRRRYRGGDDVSYDVSSYASNLPITHESPAQPEHHASLPELVGRYHQSPKAEEFPEPPVPAAFAAMPPAPPHHEPAKIVKHAKPEPEHETPKPPVHEKPVEKPAKKPESHEKPHPKTDGDDATTLRIHHDN